MPQCQKRKNRVSSNSSIPSLDGRDGESSSPAEKKKRNVFSDDEDAGEALNLCTYHWFAPGWGGRETQGD